MTKKLILTLRSKLFFLYIYSLNSKLGRPRDVLISPFQTNLHSEPKMLFSVFNASRNCAVEMERC